MGQNQSYNSDTTDPPSTKRKSRKNRLVELGEDGNMLIVEMIATPAAPLCHQWINPELRDRNLGSNMCFYF